MKITARPAVHSLACAALAAVTLLSAGCRTLTPESFAGAAPRFEPDRYFAGPTRSWGVMESRSGRPKSRFHTEMMGRRDGPTLPMYGETEVP